jgi:hypothetical protein
MTGAGPGPVVDFDHHSAAFDADVDTAWRQLRVR